MFQFITIFKILLSNGQGRLTANDECSEVSDEALNLIYFTWTQVWVLGVGVYLGFGSAKPQI